MNLFGLIGFLVTVTCLSLAILITKFGTEKAHRLWAIFNIVVAIWSANLGLAAFSSTSDLALFYWKITYTFAIFIPIVCFHFVCLLCDLKQKIRILLFYICGIILSFLSLFTNLLTIKGSIYLLNSVYINKHTLFFEIYIIFWLMIAFITFYELYKKTNTTHGIQKKRLLFFFWGLLLGYIGGLSTILLSWEIILAYPLWHIFICIHVIIMTYAIFIHELIEIKIVIKKGLIYSILIAILTLSYLAIIFLFEKLLQTIFDYQSTLVSLTAAFTLGIIFIPLRNRIQKFLDLTIFKGTQENIAAENELLRKEIAQAEKFKAVATLASGMAHEIKNPLTAIKTFAEYLETKGDDPEFRKKFSKIVNNEVDRVDNLVHELLEFARPAPLTLKETDIHKLLDETLSFLSSKLIKHNIKVQKLFNSKTQNIQADPNQLKQVFLNLILNAIDAMGQGGTLTVGTTLRGLKDQRNKGLEDEKTGLKEQRVKGLKDKKAGLEDYRVKGLKEKPKDKTKSMKSDNTPLPLYSSNPLILSVSIKDTGTGINKADLKNIFDPFFTKKDNGTGLGLAISYGIIQEHHGELSVESALGVGTTFNLEMKLDA